MASLVGELDETTEQITSTLRMRSGQLTPAEQNELSMKLSELRTKQRNQQAIST